MPERLNFGALWPVPPGRFGWTARGNAPCVMEIVSWLTTGAIDTAWPGVSPAIAEYVQAAQELLQERIDQLSQAPPPGAPAPTYVPGFGPQAPGRVRRFRSAT